MSAVVVIGRVTVAAAVVAGVALTAPVGQASMPRPVATESPTGDVGVLDAPVGHRCGAYRRTSSPQDDVRYNHCGPTRVMIEIDYRDAPNMYQCMLPWEDKAIGPVSRVVDAWYNGQSCG